MTIEFFLPMQSPPTVTHQEHKVTVRNGKPVFYETSEQKAARQLLMALLAEHKPDIPFMGPVRLTTKWIYPARNRNEDGVYKITKPDTDNIIKMFKDCMTRLCYWNDDAQVASEITEKFYGEITGIYVRVEALS